MKRRTFITLLGGAAVAWPLAARAQQADKVRRIGVLMNLAADDPESSTRIAAFAQGLGELGWNVGRNVRIDYRWGAGDVGSVRRYAAELAELKPDVILTAGLWRRCYKRPAPYRLCSCMSPILSAPASSIAWRGPAVTRPALPRLNTV
jgi:hypothetical protein